MGQKRIVEIIFLGLWIIIAFSIFVHYNKKYNETLEIPKELKIKNDLEINKIYKIKKITVLQGDLFDVSVHDNEKSRLLCKLNLNAVDNSKNSVLNLFNNSFNPRMRLIRKDIDGKWFVEIFLTNNGKDIDLSKWLFEQNLVYK